jgi:AhpC/TSA family
MNAAGDLDLYFWDLRLPQERFAQSPILSDRGKVVMSNTELEVGSSAPDFKLPSNTDGEIALSDYRGKKTVLFFVREYN